MIYEFGWSLFKMKMIMSVSCLFDLQMLYTITAQGISIMWYIV